MIIQKITNIYNPKYQKKNKYLQTHASHPTSLKIKKNIYKIFYCARDCYSKSSISSFYLNIDKMKIFSNKRLVEFKYDQGVDFFKNGISLGNIYKYNGKSYLSFMGWGDNSKYPWCGSIGILEIKKNFSLKLTSEEPLIFLEDDEISLSYPFIIQDEFYFHVWYGATTKWNPNKKFINHQIRYKKINILDRKIVDFKKNVIPNHKIGNCFSKPSIIKINDINILMLSYKNSANSNYKIVFYKSLNLNDWELIKNDELTPSNLKWENNMVEYGSFIKTNKGCFILYNGNDYGKTGIGIANIRL